MAYASVGRRRRWLAPALAGIAVAFLVYSLPPYFTGDTRVPATFGFHYPLLVAHVMFATVAMGCAVAQVWMGFRTHGPVLHRRVGRVYVYSAIPAAVCAMIVGAATPFGPFLAASNVVLASLWLWFTIKGYIAGRQRRVAEHRRHMVRSATLALSVITNRIWTPALIITLHPLQDTVFNGNEQHFLWLAAGAGAWLGWTIPFVLVQWWLTRRPAPPSLSRGSLDPGERARS